MLLFFIIVSFMAAFVAGELWQQKHRFWSACLSFISLFHLISAIGYSNQL